MKEETPIIISNWKLYLNLGQSLSLARQLKNYLAKTKKNFTLVLCPSFLALPPVKKIIAGSRIKLGGQNVARQKKGALTGEISLNDLRKLAVEYVIIGHSERRRQAGETDEIINRKLKEVLDSRVIPILCVGETWSERRQGQKLAVVRKQLLGALKGVKAKKKIIVAYEPVWSIYPGRPCDPFEADKMGRAIKKILFGLYPRKIVSKNFQLVYGGSVDEKNFDHYLNLDIYEGILIGKASTDFKTIISILNKL